MNSNPNWQPSLRIGLDHKGVFLRADEKIPYGYVMEVMGLIRQAGIDQIGMVTEPAKSAAPNAQQKGKGKI